MCHFSALSYRHHLRVRRSAGLTESIPVLKTENVFSVSITVNDRKPIKSGAFL